MHFAAQANAPGAIAALVDHGADVDASDTFSGRTPLMFASVRNATEAMQALVNANADLSLTTAVKDFVAISEAANEDRSRRQRIRDAAAEPDPDAAVSGRGGRGGPPGAGRGRGGQTPPDSADAEEEEEEEEITDPAADTFPEVVSLSSQEQIGKQGGFTALHFAAREGHREATALLRRAGADIDQVTAGDESSPLLVAVINGNYDLARDLLEAGADPNLVSDDGAGPLFAALNIEWSLRTWYPQPQMFRSQETTYLDLMERLLEAGADPNQRTSTHIWYAAYNAGRMGVDFTGATPFWRAAYAADVNAMRLLHSYGADPNLWTYNLPARQRFGFGGPPQDEEEEDPSGLPPVPVGGHGVHPLHAAAGVGHGTSRVAQQHRHVPDGWLPAVQYLVDEIGVDPNIRDYAGFSAVHHAAARGDNETILFLVSRGADVTLLARSGQTTADMANSPEQRAQPHPATIALLEKLGSKNNHNCRSCGQGGQN
jgi:ankyrin repeat protein